MSGIAKVVLSPIAAIGGALFGKPKVPKVPIQPPPATPRANASALADQLARRRGSLDNRRSGDGEPLGGVKTKLGG